MNDEMINSLRIIRDDAKDFYTRINLYQDSIFSLHLFNLVLNIHTRNKKILSLNL